MLLDVRELKKWFEVKKGLFGRKQYVKAVDGVSFQLDKGEAISIVGESGSGKTTLGKTILRLYEPTDGRIYFEGRDITRLKRDDLRWYRKETSLIQQDPFGAFASHFSIYRILKEPLIVNKVTKEEEEMRERIYNVLKDVKLDPEEFAFKYPHMLSGGQLQRIAIARALILKPKLVIADEPVSMLDASVRVDILTLMRELQKKHEISFMYITHDIATTRYFSDRIAIMYAGHMVEMASTTSLLKEPLHPYTKALLNAIPDPDPENRRRYRDVPPGEPPSLIDPPKGCRFHPRCPYVKDICREKEPPSIDVNGHMVKCWLYG